MVVGGNYIRQNAFTFLVAHIHFLDRNPYVKCSNCVNHVSLNLLTQLGRAFLAVFRHRQECPHAAVRHAEAGVG